MPDVHKEMNKEIKQLEKNIGLSLGYYSKLLSEDDCSFIIKLSALYVRPATFYEEYLPFVQEQIINKIFTKFTV